MMDLELMDRALDYIGAHPDEWYQGNWPTCLAGHMARLAGHRAPDVVILAVLGITVTIIATVVLVCTWAPADRRPPTDNERRALDNDTD